MRDFTVESFVSTIVIYKSFLKEPLCNFLWVRFAEGKEALLKKAQKRYLAAAKQADNIKR
jgi:hypothetical protein